MLVAPTHIATAKTIAKIIPPASFVLSGFMFATYVVFPTKRTEWLVLNMYAIRIFYLMCKLIMALYYLGAVKFVPTCFFSYFIPEPSVLKFRFFPSSQKTKLLFHSSPSARFLFLAPRTRRCIAIFVSSLAMMFTFLTPSPSPLDFEAGTSDSILCRTDSEPKQFADGGWCIAQGTRFFVAVRIFVV
jgi:hypothetical protein